MACILKKQRVINTSLNMILNCINYYHSGFSIYLRNNNIIYYIIICNYCLQSNPNDILLNDIDKLE